MKADDRVVAQSLPLLVAVRSATGASASLVPENLVMNASLDMRPVLAIQYDRMRSDYVVHTLEITLWV